MEEQPAALAETLDFRTCEVDLAIEGHENLNGLDLRVVCGDHIAVMNQFIAEVFDSMTQDFQGPPGNRIDVTPAIGAPNNRFCSRSRGGNRKCRS